MNAPWLLVAGDFTPLGGMDVANYALARYLARTSDELHLVTHRAWPDLAALPTVTVHQAWRPFGRHLLGGPFLAETGRGVWRQLRRGAHTIVNGGNCQVPATNWVHYLHAAYEPRPATSTTRRVRQRWMHNRDRAAEARALRDARVVICNSNRTRRDVADRLGVPEARLHVVYYGSDSQRFRAISGAERSAARLQLGYADGRPLVGFVGALGDRRKAFDTLFEAWSALCARGSQWDADLIVIGAGAELDSWRGRAADAGLGQRIRFLGFRDDVPDVLAALDAMVHPARYEAYGLSVHEAICRGLPALVSASAGVAERYPGALADLLIANPDDSEELQVRLTDWRTRADHFARMVAPLSASLRSQSWDVMAATIVDLVERAA